MSQKFPNPRSTGDRPTSAAAPPLTEGHTGFAQLFTADGWEVVSCTELARLRRIEAAARAVAYQFTYESELLPKVIELRAALAVRP